MWQRASTLACMCVRVCARPSVCAFVIFLPVWFGAWVWALPPLWYHFPLVASDGTTLNDGCPYPPLARRARHPLPRSEVEWSGVWGLSGVEWVSESVKSNYSRKSTTIHEKAHLFIQKKHKSHFSWKIFIKCHFSHKIFIGLDFSIRKVTFLKKYASNLISRSEIL